jgi:group I intron endonuclease
METNTGVYKIYFKGSKDWGYIGSSINLKNRKSIHFHYLRKNNHPNIYLQEAYNKYGESNLEFFVIEYLPDSITKDELKSVEQYWIDTVGHDNLYNICPSADGSVIADETRQKLSEANKGENNPNYGKPLSDETRQKLSEALKGENHPMHGKTHSDKTKQKMSDAKTGGNNPMHGKTLSDEHKQKISETNKGKTRSDETKLKISESKKGKTPSDEHKQKLSEARRKTDVWNNYQWIKDLHIRTGWGYRRVCKAYNQEFSTNHKYPAFMNVLKKIKTEISIP